MKQIIFLSYEPGMGGSAFYQAINIDYLLSNGNNVILIDENPEYTLNYVQMPNHDHFKVIKEKVWSGGNEINPLLKTLVKSYKKTIIALSNPGVLVRYFSILKNIRNQFKTKIIITLHSGMLSMTARRYFLEWAASFAMLHMNKVIFVSIFTQHYWKKRYPWLHISDSCVVSNGVTIPQILINRRRNGNLRIGFVGRINPEKDPKLFCEIAQLARNLRSAMEFHMFGDGPLLLKLEREYYSSIILHGLVKNQDEIYNQIDLLLVTSPVENCPFAVLQAKSYGIPTVSSAVGGLPEIIQSGLDGIVIKERTAESMLKALQEAQIIYDKLSIGCLKNRLKYSIQKSAQNTWDDL